MRYEMRRDWDQACYSLIEISDDGTEKVVGTVTELEVNTSKLSSSGLIARMIGRVRHL